MNIPHARLSLWTRGFLVTGTLGIVAVLGLARLLTPNPEGFGTHTQLGMLPCGFFQSTGHPCPSCGMTTAFAWMTRGQVSLACRANPAGSLLALACVALIPWLVASALTGRPCWGARSIDGPLIVFVVTAVGVSLAVWAVRLVLGRAFG